MNIKYISIPTPCSQDWEQMTKAKDGRYCQSCCKTVTDFIGMSNQQIIDVISNNHNICGRFNEPQLRSINFELQTKKGFSWKRLGLAASLLFVLSACKTMGQPKLTGKIIKKDRDTTAKSVKVLGIQPCPLLSTIK